MTGSVEKKFSSNVAITLAARILMAFNSVAAGAVIARLLGTEGLGIYLILSSTSQILVQTAGLSLHVGNTYFTAREPEKTGSAFVNSVIFAVAGSLALIASVYALSTYLLPDISSDLIAVVLLSVPFQVITGYVINFFLVQGEVRRFNLIDLVNQSFIFINAIVVLLVLGLGLLPLVLFNTAAAALVSIFAALSIISLIKYKLPSISWTPDKELFIKTIRYSAKGFILWIATFIVYRVDLLVLNYFRGADDSAPYAVATQCSMFLLLLPHAVSHLLQAKVSANIDNKGEFTAKASRNTSLLLAVACIVSFPGAHIVVMIYGTGFVSLPPLLWILLPGVYFVGIQSVIAQYFVGTGLPIILPILWVIALILNIIGNFIFIPPYGAVGAAAVSSVCYFLVFAAVAALFKNRTGIGIRHLLLPNSKELREAWSNR